MHWNAGTFAAGAPERLQAPEPAFQIPGSAEVMGEVGITASSGAF